MKKKWKKTKIFPISAATGEGLDALLAYVAKETAKPAPAEEEVESAEPFRFVVELDYEVRPEAEGVWRVSGRKVEKLAAMTNFDQSEGLRRFQNILKKMGVEKELMRQGAEPGDTVSSRTSNSILKWTMKNPETSHRSAPTVRSVDNLRFLLAVSLSAFIVLLSVNLGHLLDPPYWDGLVGVYSQGVWLLRHHMNYAGLLAEPAFGQGGSNIDVFYAFAPLFALLSSILRPGVVFLMFHLIVLACAAWTIALFAGMLRGRRPAWPWVLWILSAATDPIWSGQTASMYLEVPFAALSGTSIYCLWQGWYGWAAGVCLAAWFIKGTALLQALGGALFAVAFAAWSRLRGKGPVDVRMALLCVPLPVLLLLKRWVMLAPILLKWKPADYFVMFFHRSLSLYPAAAFGFFVVVLLCVVQAAMWRRSGSDLPEADARLAGFLAVFVLGFWASFLIYPNALPRYLCAILFPQALLAAFLLRRRPWVSGILAGTLLVVNLVNQDGCLLPRLSPGDGRSGHELERSREYLVDLESNCRLCRELEAQAFDHGIMVKWPFTQMLRLPELGYVRRPLPRVIEAGLQASLTGAIPLETFLRMNPLPGTLCVYAPNVFDQRWGATLKPMADETILLEDHALSPPVIVYRRDWERFRRLLLAAARQQRGS